LSAARTPAAALACLPFVTAHVLVLVLGTPTTVAAAYPNQNPMLIGPFLLA
jgi:hypothetical protein